MHSPRSRTRTRGLATAALALALAGSVLSACGDDEDAAATDTGTDAGVDAPSDDGLAAGSGGLSAAACDAYAALGAGMVGDPAVAAEAATALAAELPADLEAAGTTLADTLSGDPDGMGSPEFTAAWAEVGDAAFDACEADAQLDVTGVDYGFEGLPTTVDAGRVALRFTNGTTAGEPHELVLMRRNDGVTESVDELLALPEEQIGEKLTMAGVVFADAAGTSSVLLTDLEAGGYIAICMIPVGGGEDGAPHAAHGMVAEIEAS